MIKKKIDPSKIREFLIKNPDFFIENPELLNKINFPILSHNKNTVSNIVSFKDWIIKALKIKQKTIITNAHFNFLTQKKIHNAIIELIKTYSFKNLTEFLKNSLPKIIDVDCSFIISSSKNIKEIGGTFMKKEKIEPLIMNAKTIFMDAVDEEIGIFEGLSYKVYSNALISLNRKIFDAPAMLVFGSKEKIFINNKGSDLIFFFSNVFQQHCMQIKKNEKNRSYIS